MSKCHDYLARKVLDAVVLLVALAVLVFAGSLVRDAYFGKAAASDLSADYSPTLARMNRIEAKLDAVIAAQEGE